MFYGMVKPGSTIRELADIRRGLLPEEEDFGNNDMFRLFKSMISSEPNLRPEAKEIIKKCEDIITKIRNKSYN